VSNLPVYSSKKEMIAMIGYKELNKGKFGVIEKTTQRDTALLSRIIRNGGLIEYAKKLESINESN